MPSDKLRDEIDIELTKTYFGSAFGSEKPRQFPKAWENPHQSRESVAINSIVNTRKPKSLLKKIYTFGIIIIFLGIIMFLSHFLPKHNYVTAKTSVPEKKFFTSSVSLPYKTLYDFENDTEGWEIPLWAKDKTDHVASSLSQTREIAKTGTGSLKFHADFLKERWSAALVEISHYLDLSSYSKISVSVYIPAETPKTLKGKIILTVGEDWNFVEMMRAKRLIPGKWNTITVSIAEGSTEWRRTVIDKAFKEDVRKISIRISSNEIPYSGVIYIDNVRLLKTI